MPTRRTSRSTPPLAKQDVISALSALAQETRLDVFRALVRAGEAGRPAGAVAEDLDIPAATLSFHLKELKNARLVSAERQGRNVVYRADYPTMTALLAYLTENCCAGEGC